MTHSICFCAALLSAASLMADSPIHGTVKDPQGRPVDGAALVLYRQGSSAPAARVKSRNGEFQFPALATGEYLLEATALGFSRETVPVSGSGAVIVNLRVAGLDQHVFVTAESAAETADQISKATTVISAAEIAQRNEFSLSEVLRDSPGLLIRNLGGPGQVTTIRTRGLRADATSILVDGLRFRDASTLQGDASSFIQSLNVIDLDRVEVLRGSGSSLYGSNAVGGTINLVSGSGGDTHGGVLMEGGGLGLLRGRANVSGALAGDRLLYSAGLLHLNLLSGVDGDDRVRSSGAQSFARYLFNPRASLSGRLWYSDDFGQANSNPAAIGAPTAFLVPAIAGTSFTPNRNDPDSRRTSRMWSGAMIFRQALTSNADWQSSLQRVDTTRFFRNGPAGFGFQPVVSNGSEFRGGITTFDTRLSLRPLRWMALTGGYEFEHEDYFNHDDNRVPGPANVSVRTEVAQRSNAVYFANQLSLAGQRLRVSTSGRMQSFHLNQPRFDYRGTVNNYARVPVVSAPRAWTGDLALSYFFPTRGTKLRAHAGNSYRAPGLYERYGTGFFFNSFSNSVGASPYGDPLLAPDRYNSVDGGVDQYLLGDRVRLSATWFYTRIVQITQFDFSNSYVRGATDRFGRFSGYYNGAGGISRGLEFTAEARPLRTTLLRGSYSYVNADTDQDLGVRGVFRALSVPSHTFALFVNQRMGRKTDVTFDLQRASSHLAPMFAGGASRAFQFPGFTKADLVLSHELWSGEHHVLKGHFKVDNVFDRRYYENGFLAPGAVAIGGLQVTFR